MKLIKHFYYPYYYIEQFNGGINTIFFLDQTFHYEDEYDLFIERSNFYNKMKSKKVIELSFETKKDFIDLNKTVSNFDFFHEFFS